MNRNEMLVCAAICAMVATMSIFTPRNGNDQEKCNRRHLSVGWRSGNRLAFVEINGHRIEATNGVVSLDFYSFAHEHGLIGQMATDTNLLTLPDADVGARPEIWIASTNNTMRRVQFTNVNSPVSSLRPIDASLRPSVVGESFRDIIQTNRVVLTLEADGRITYEKIPLKPR